jgi:hypothetical protein
MTAQPAVAHQPGTEYREHGNLEEELSCTFSNFSRRAKRIYLSLFEFYSCSRRNLDHNGNEEDVYL